MPLNLKLDGNSDSPLYKQIVEAIQRAVHSGKLPSGYQLPTVRELADEMGISRGTIKHASGLNLSRLFAYSLIFTAVSTL